MTIVDFKRENRGVRLKNRGSNDPHIIVTLLSEDDEMWFEKCSFSSSWLDEMIEVLSAAKDWMEKNAKEDRYDMNQNTPIPTDDPSGRQFGYKFKT